MAGLKRGRLLSSGRPAIVGVLNGSLSPALADKAVSAGADAVEVRVDTLRDRRIESLAAGLKAIRGRRVPVLLTVRSVKEGGVHAVPDPERAAIYRALAPLVDAIDVELGSHAVLAEAAGAARKAGAGVILSFHDFKGTPGTKALRGIVGKARSAGADAVKIAAAANDPGDIKRLALLLLECDNLVVIAMGDAGRFTRVFFPMLGSLLTYGSVGAGSAPGQLPVSVIKKEFTRYGY